MQTDEFETSHTFTKPKRPMLLGLRSSAVVEMLVALVVLLAINVVFTDHTRYWSVNPHPFWFIVLFIACKYGTKEAVVAAILCSLALVVGNMPEQTMGQDSYAYALYVLKNPLLWLVSAVAFGELRQMHIRERDRLEDALIESENREQGLADSYQQVKALKDALELKTAGQLRSSVSAYHAAKSMEKLTPSEVIKGLGELVDASLHPSQFSIYNLTNKGLDATLMQGWKDSDKYLRHFGSGSALYQAVVGKQEVLCVINSDQERLMGSEGILAGPLMDKETGEVVGMLKIEKMAFGDLNLSNIEAFSAICEWAGMTLVNARKYQTAKADSIVNPDHNLFTQGYFQRHTDYIKSLAERVSFDVSMVAIKLTNPDRLDLETRTRVARTLSDAVDTVLRKVDLAFDHQQHGGEFAVVLPTTNRRGAQIVLDKIQVALEKNVAKISRTAEFTFTVQTLYEKRAA